MRGGLRSFLGVVLVLAGAAAPAPAAAAELTGTEFVGPESCKACHPDAYAAWRQSKHARAIESLSEQQQKDARCLSCHAPSLQDRRVESISCETCHGGGQYYAAQYVMKDPELVRLVGLQDPSEMGCRSCHDASSPSLKPFDFVEKLKLIDHWTVERQRKDQPRTAAAAGAPPALAPVAAPPPGNAPAEGQAPAENGADAAAADDATAKPAGTARPVNPAGTATKPAKPPKKGKPKPKKKK
ncbi:MAG TPA: multiheme c-type cytochrome [Myxococcales bacterium]|nr:multiheme c-type cytochrome [Myxococcales bacterium]